jgi:hypothetical protein
VHYRVARTIDASTLTTVRDLVPTKLAASVWNCLARYKSAIPEFPQTETCELLIVDRSIDQVRDDSCMFEILFSFQRLPHEFWLLPSMFDIFVTFTDRTYHSRMDL